VHEPHFQLAKTIFVEGQKLKLRSSKNRVSFNEPYAGLAGAHYRASIASKPAAFCKELTYKCKASFLISSVLQ
jgi:hypothetical protein